MNCKERVVYFKFFDGHKSFAFVLIFRLFYTRIHYTFQFMSMESEILYHSDKNKVSPQVKEKHADRRFDKIVYG
jgi:hypothetical protein